MICNTLAEECLTIELRIERARLAMATDQLVAVNEHLALVQEERDFSTDALCDALNQLALARDLLRVWKSAPAQQLSTLQAELSDMREEMIRYTRRQMS